MKTYAENNHHTPSPAAIIPGGKGYRMFHFIRESDNQGYYTDNPEDLYDAVEKTTGDISLAIEVSSWADIYYADIDRSFEHDQFTVYVAEGE